MLIEMTIKGLMVDPITNMPIVILKDKDGRSVLPIWVGVFEANAIALQIENIPTPRPMTHDLLRNIITDLDGRVDRVVVSDLKDNTFYALDPPHRPRRARSRSTRGRATRSPWRCARGADPGGGDGHRQRQDVDFGNERAGRAIAAAVARSARSGGAWQIQDVIVGRPTIRASD